MFCIITVSSRLKENPIFVGFVFLPPCVNSCAQIYGQINKKAERNKERGAYRPVAQVLDPAI